jgi:hypothetical protein
LGFWVAAELDVKGGVELGDVDLYEMEAKMKMRYDAVEQMAA